jgi:hypothetical protein
VLLAGCGKASVEGDLEGVQGALPALDPPGTQIVDLIVDWVTLGL